ncbi:transcriptional repressor TUP1 [Neohortaea acidophila]|uniref:Transcriptional repressor TUP1 n=1 Tax=Neohortaea acidophila TaxID=245834 RepID=A0A6A6PXU2_9PEZI|nr:transcriptional repressor TUP1 [Neohortaea acidophila]KAF2484571.1 transcriptional repressor TUP1 [Neohortaea acidophila]
MYNAHRGMPPGAQPANRLAELLDQVRAEFEAQAAGRSNDQEHQLVVQAQTNEMNLVVQRLRELEASHHSIKQRYEDEIARLHRELEQRSGPPQVQHGGPSQPPPPAIGHGPANLFQGIMAGGGQGGPGLAPPQEQQGQPGMPGHMQAGQPPPGLNQHAPAPQNPFGYGQPPGPSINGYPSSLQNASPAQGIARPTLPIDRNAQIAPDFQYSLAEIERIGNQLSEFEIEKLPPNLKTVSDDDWHVLYNPNPHVPRSLDIELVHTLNHSSVVCCVRFSHDGKFVATGCNRSAQIYDVASGQLVSQLQDDTVSQEGDLYIRSVCFSPDGKYLATGAEDKIIRVWDIYNKVVRHSFSGHEQDIYSLDYARNGKIIASGSGDRTIRIWDLEAGACHLSLSIEDGVTTVAMSPDARYVAAGSLDKSVRVWDTQNAFLVMRTEGETGHKDSVYSVAFMPNGRDLVSGSLDRTIKLWRIPDRANMSQTSGECLRTFEGHIDFVLSVASTPDGNYILSGSKDRGVRFWDPRNGNALLLLQGHKNSVISVAPSPVGGLFATGSGDMKARIWSYRHR